MFFSPDTLLMINAAVLFLGVCIWPEKKVKEWPPAIDVKVISLPRCNAKKLGADILIKQSVAKHKQILMDEINPETELGYKYQIIQRDLVSRVGKRLNVDEHTTVEELIRQATKEG